MLPEPNIETFLPLKKLSFWLKKDHVALTVISLGLYSRILDFLIFWKQIFYKFPVSTTLSFGWIVTGIFFSLSTKI